MFKFHRLVLYNNKEQKPGGLSIGNLSDHHQIDSNNKLLCSKIIIRNRVFNLACCFIDEEVRNRAFS